MSKTIFLDVQVPVYFEVLSHLSWPNLQNNLTTHVVGGFSQSDGDREAGRHLGVQRLWRPAHLHHLAQGKQCMAPSLKKMIMYWWLRARIDQDDNNILLLLILLLGREADRSTATWRGSPSWRRTRPQGWWPASPSGGLAIFYPKLLKNWSTLWFPREVTRADGREYTCVASNKFGSKVSFFPSLFHRCL